MRPRGLPHCSQLRHPHLSRPAAVVRLSDTPARRTPPARAPHKGHSHFSYRAAARCPLLVAPNSGALSRTAGHSTTSLSPWFNTTPRPPIFGSPSLCSTPVTLTFSRGHILELLPLRTTLHKERAPNLPSAPDASPPPRQSRNPGTADSREHLPLTTDTETHTPAGHRVRSGARAQGSASGGCKGLPAAPRGGCHVLCPNAGLFHLSGNLGTPRWTDGRTGGWTHVPNICKS